MAEKYRALTNLRRRRDANEPEPSRSELRAIAGRFPGALRELDTLGAAELHRRAEAAEGAAIGGPTEPWMAWVLALHRLLAAAHLLKRFAGPGHSRSGALATNADFAAACAQAERLAQITLSRELIENLLKPPGGRLTPLVLAEVAARFSRPVSEVAATLLPSRRARQ